MRFRPTVVALACLLLLAPVAGCGGRASSAPPKEEPEESAVLYLTVMLHLEGWENEANNRSSFQAHAGKLREYADIFDRYGAKLTIEAKREFVGGCRNFRDNVLQEMYDRGHGVGVHAEVGAEQNLTQKQFTSELKDMRTRMEALGFPVRHVSGISSPLDWVTAAADAGYSFVSGVVEYALLSLSSENVPEEYLPAVERGGGPAMNHGSVPYAMEERIHPWRMASGADWLTPAPEGPLVIMPGSGGDTLPNLAEGAESAMNAFNQQDIEVFRAELEKALAAADPKLVNVWYVGWSLGAFADGAVLEQLLQAIEPYVLDGRVVWKSLPEVYDIFLEWERNGGAAAVVEP
ncbi:MAG: hypothetical protein ACYC55_06515 [Candidatus Geothermincolia bacterium]